jgi:hypothetical protein
VWRHVTRFSSHVGEREGLIHAERAANVDRPLGEQLELPVATERRRLNAGCEQLLQRVESRCALGVPTPRLKSPSPFEQGRGVADGGEDIIG